MVSIWKSGKIYSKIRIGIGFKFRFSFFFFFFFFRWFFLILIIVYMSCFTLMSLLVRIQQTKFFFAVLYSIYVVCDRMDSYRGLTNTHYTLSIQNSTVPSSIAKLYNVPTLKPNLSAPPIHSHTHTHADASIYSTSCIRCYSRPHVMAKRLWVCACVSTCLCVYWCIHSSTYYTFSLFVCHAHT